MLSLEAKIREKLGRKTKSLRKQGFLPAVLYGPEIKNLSLEVPEKEFEKIYKEAGESSIIKLKIKNQKSKSNEMEVLIHQTAKDPVKGNFLHVDFYHPSSRKEVEAEIPLRFEGEAPAVEELGGTLVKEIQQVEVKGLAQNLPREIKVDIGKLRTFEDRILIRDLKVPQGIKILRESNEIVANVAPPGREEEKPVEEEKPAEEKLEEEKEGEEEEKGRAERETRSK
ncbi:50S ribosomal protein L25 [bacterium]|nr:50S ribosomal protein L25 [bacterium]